MPESHATRSLWVLIVSNVAGGIGVASGISVGALLTQQIGGTQWAGVGQAASVLGAGLAAVPLASLAARSGRRRALTLGYTISTVGGLVVLGAAAIGSLVLLLAGLTMFGSAQAANLQTRYAASDTASPQKRARTISLVVWATTIGSVMGPNLMSAGARVGGRLGLPDLAGPYLFAIAAFAVAGIVISLLLPGGLPTQDQSPRPESMKRAVSAPKALVWASKHPVARFAVLLIAVAHAVMVGLMSMTSVHLADHQHGLPTIGAVISLHILGMYAFSPVFGWLADRFGAMTLSLGALVTLAVSLGLGWVAGWNADLPVTIAALFLLGIGWSAALIASSALLSNIDSGEVRVPLQGATDAVMSYSGAAAAIAGGPVLAAIGYSGLSLASGVLLIPAVVVGWLAHRAPDPGFAVSAQR